MRAAGLGFVIFVGGCSLVTNLDGLSGDGGVDAGLDAKDSGVDAVSDVVVDAAPDVFIPPSTVVALDVGGQLDNTTSGAHACVIAGADRSVYCWGANGFGQLGLNSTNEALTPTKILADSTSQAFTGVQSISTGSWNTCAIANGGFYACWGLRAQGGVGDGINASAQLTPKVQVSGYGNIQLGGAHACMVKTNDIYCFGDDHHEESGVGIVGATSCNWFADTTGLCIPVPTKAIGIGTAPAEMSAGIWHTCVRNGAGNVQCWGSAYNYQTGDSSGFISRPSPFTVTTDGTTPLAGVVQISSRGRHNCVLKNDKTVWCWGQNDAGQLGRAISPKSATAGVVTGLVANSVTVGERASCAVTGGNNEVVCWGDDNFGQLGDGNTVPSTTPVSVKGPGGVGKLSGVSGLALAYGFACALTIDKSVYCWGHNDHGQLGDGTKTDRPFPTRVLGLP